MKTKLFPVSAMLIAVTSINLSAQKTTDIAPTYPGNSCYFDDTIGYSEFYVCTGKTLYLSIQSKY